MLKAFRRWSLPCLIAVTAGCATTTDLPSSTAQAAQAAEVAEVSETTGVDTRPVPATALAPTTGTVPMLPPFIGHDTCGARVTLVRASPVLFEDDLVGGLREVELDVVGPVGLAVGIEGWSKVPVWDAVELPPKVALRLPAGPATDRSTGASGALFDLGGLALAGFANLITLPLSIPFAVLSASPDLFFFEAPSFAEGMFNDVVLDKQAWQAEVARRGAPHKAVLAVEAKRQARFHAFRDDLMKRALAPSCIVDDSGHCLLRFTWPMDSLSARFSGLPCTVPATTVNEGGIVDTTADDRHNRVTGTLPALPTLPTPLVLEVPPNPDERRGHGAVATRDAWRSDRNNIGELESAFHHANMRGARGMALHDVDLVCRIATRGNDFDLDGSAPELRARLAWGFDQDVVGQSFGERTTRTLFIAVSRASFEPGELVKLSVVDVDTLIDDWVGMDIVTFDGTLPLRFSHRSFGAECRALRSR
jgi:hypothetical protein